MKIHALLVLGMLLSIGALKSKAQSYTWMEKNSFNIFRASVVNGIGTTPFYDENAQAENVRSPKFTTSLISEVARIEYEKRFNLLTYSDKFSWSVSGVSPIKFFIGGIYNLVAPYGYSFGLNIYTDINIFHGSTYNNISDIGLSFGVGLRNELIASHFQGLYGKVLQAPEFRFGFTKSTNWSEDKKFSIMFYFGIPERFSTIEGGTLIANRNISFCIRF